MVASQSNKSRLAACRLPEGRRPRIAGERPVGTILCFVH